MNSRLKKLPESFEKDDAADDDTVEPSDTDGKAP
jgi:hypothetical protein